MSKLSVSQLKPMAGYVLVEPHQQGETKTKSGIILAAKEEEKPQYGKVLAVGEYKSFGDKMDNCCGGDMDYDKKTNSSVKAGDKVVYKKWGGNEVMIDDVEYQLLKFEDILAIIK